MAKTLDIIKQLREHMVINPNTTGSSEHISNYMKDSGWTGELFVQVKDGGASLWTLAADNETAIEFISKDQIEILANLQISAITPSEANIKEEYALVDPDGTILGETVKIYKDSALYSVYLGHVDDALVSDDSPEYISGSGDTALCFIYLLSDGKYSLTAIDIEEFLQENEFADGLEVEDHIVTVKIDENSEKVITEYNETGNTEEEVLSVSEDGVKVSHIQEAIDAAIDTVNAFSAITDGDGNYIEAEPGDMLTISGSDTVNVAIDADEKKITLTSPEVTIAGDSYVAAEANNHDITITSNVVDSAEDFKSDEESHAGKLVDAQVIKDVILENEEAIAAALNQLNDAIERIDETIEVSAATQDIATSTALGEGHADAFDVKGFAINDVDTTDSATTSGVKVQVVDGLRKMDFSKLIVDCGTF